MAEKMNNNSEIKGIRLSGKREIKSVNYADDVTLTLRDAHSVNLAIDTVDRFQMASGLKLNKQKTQGLRTKNSFPEILLPDIKWHHENFNLLGTKIGKINLNQIWQEIDGKIKSVINEIDSTYATLDAKEVLIKARLLPVSNYAAQTYPAPTEKIKKINERIVRYAVGKYEHADINTLQLPKLDGGLNFPNFEIYADIIYIRSILKYCQARVQNEPLNVHTTYIEYQIGHAIADVLEVVRLNNIPHTETRSPYYETIMQIINKYNLKRNDLIERKIKKTYERIIQTKKLKAISDLGKIWERTHLKILPSYLRTFNYKCAWNLLPFCNETGNYTPASKNSCPFCKVGPDAAYHVFFKCPQTNKQWKQTIKDAEELLQINLQNENVESLCQLMYNNDRHPNKDQLLTTLITATKHQIWKTRLKCVIDNQAFSLNKLRKDVNKACNSRITTIRRDHPNIMTNE
ncbi:unnamed protein product [Clavelina lepadiformis]|uniref:Reverse transcriptase domain-containing protein n=1 Tax=Clavelina lepadiformis TaxID=159417 RepID=A0ABP0FYM3_CLALP